MSERLVIAKYGTSQVARVNQAGQMELDYQAIGNYGQQVDDLVEARDCSLIIVTSGAIAVGKQLANHPHETSEPPSLRQMQMFAGLGAIPLGNAWRTSIRSTPTGQALLSGENLDPNNVSSVHLLHTLSEYLQGGFVPIINANDAVYPDEITTSDNDLLAASLAELISGSDDLTGYTPELVLFTSGDGIYKDPKNKKRGYFDTVRFSDIPSLVRSRNGSQRASKTGIGRGGVKSKLLAAERLSRLGISTRVASGRRPNSLIEAVRSGRGGTLFSK